MRRVIALVAAAALAVSLSGASLAAAPTQAATSFVGSFDVVLEGEVLYHIDAQMWPSSADKPTSGWYTTRTLDGKISSSASVADVAFNRNDGYNEVWFNGMEWGLGGTNAIFTGHFVDNLDRTLPDTIEFWGTPIDNFLNGGAWGASLGTDYYFAFTVGRGAFVLTIR